MVQYPRSMLKKNGAGRRRWPGDVGRRCGPHKQLTKTRFHLTRHLQWILLLDTHAPFQGGCVHHSRNCDAEEVLLHLVSRIETQVISTRMLP